MKKLSLLFAFLILIVWQVFAPTVEISKTTSSRKDGSTLKGSSVVTKGIIDGIVTDL